MSRRVNDFKALNVITEFIGFKALFGLVRRNRLFNFLNRT
jgi:hypothetical protein